jgi:hypothetical protein
MSRLKLCAAAWGKKGHATANARIKQTRFKLALPQWYSQAFENSARTPISVIKTRSGECKKSETLQNVFQLLLSNA